eukprot:SAG31_NODE_1126_length_9767_cov_5.580058_2_plen_268_part_00
MYIGMRDVDPIVHGDSKKFWDTATQNHPDDLLPVTQFFSHAARAAMSMFGYVFADITDAGFYFDSGGFLATFWHVILLFMITLSLNNLLIAIVGDAWADAKSRARPWNRYTMAAFSVATILARLRQVEKRAKHHLDAWNQDEDNHEQVDSLPAENSQALPADSQPVARRAGAGDQQPSAALCGSGATSRSAARQTESGNKSTVSQRLKRQRVTFARRHSPAQKLKQLHLQQQLLRLERKEVERQRSVALLRVPVFAAQILSFLFGDL